MEIFSEISFNKVFDVLLIGVILYRIAFMIKGTRAMSVTIGLLILAILYSIIRFFNLTYTSSILSYFFNHLVIIVILLFQDEIRRFLADLGRQASSTGKKVTFSSKTKKKNVEEIAEAISDVAYQMGKERIGGLIIIEKDDKLKSIIETGSTLYSILRPELIYSIFLPSSPIHDGAVIISDGEIAAAGCFLPISREPGLNKKYGTRHRAAIATSQSYDCIVVVISEETGHINLSVNGKMNHNLSAEELKQSLIVLQSDESTSLNMIQHSVKIVKNIFWFLKTKIKHK